MKHENIAIVGAGIGGLSAALRIADTGRDVKVVDTKIDPHAPIPTSTRLTIAFARLPILKALGLSTDSSPVFEYIVKGERLEDFEKLPPEEIAMGIDALRVRRTLLQRADAHPQIELVEGKATTLHVDPLRGRGKSRVTAVELKNGIVLETGENGLVVVATGVDRNLLTSENFDELGLPSPQGYRTLGGYITSPALERHPKNIARIERLNGTMATLVPSEQIEPGGTKFATYFMVNKDMLDEARGGAAKALAVMQKITRGTRWEEYYSDATLDRVLLYTHPGNSVRIPSVEGAVLVGDARVYLDPSNGSGFARIAGDINRLKEYISTTPDLTTAGTVYNSSYPTLTIRS